MDDPNHWGFMHQYCFITWVCKWMLYECLLPSYFLWLNSYHLKDFTPRLGNYFFVLLCNRYQANTHIPHCYQRKFSLEHWWFFPLSPINMYIKAVLLKNYGMWKTISFKNTIKCTMMRMKYIVIWHWLEL